LSEIFGKVMDGKEKESEREVRRWNMERKDSWV